MENQMKPRLSFQFDKCHTHTNLPQSTEMLESLHFWLLLLMLFNDQHFY